MEDTSTATFDFKPSPIELIAGKLSYRLGRNVDNEEAQEIALDFMAHMLSLSDVLLGYMVDATGKKK